MAGFSSWLVFALGFCSIGGTQAQQTGSFTDPKTGIVYQQFVEDAFTFGISLPETPSSDFIGRLSGKLSAGWAGISLAGKMSGSLMVVAWPNQGGIVGSIRKGTGYSSPAEFTGTGVLKAILNGTSVDDSSYTYTFLCEGCLQTDGSTFADAADSATMGWAIAAAAVSSPSSPSSPLTFHSTGYGTYTADLAACRSKDFAKWAEMAVDPEDPPGDEPGTSPPGNGTVPISNSTYDYIVVGGGPAGLIASQRLTETGRSVLLIERGQSSTASTGGTRYVPFNNTLTYYDVPGVFYSLPTDTQGEGYCTDTAAVAGCILGGGGSVNGMAFIHPPKWDFDDNWPEGWKWSNVEASASRLYDRNPGTTLPSRDGKRYDEEVSDVLTPWLEENGWTFADGIESPDEKIKSYGPTQLNIANGLRSGPIQTYLPLALAKGTFELQLNTKVVRTIRNGSTITGVETQTSEGREIINLKTGGSVLLAAGVMSTPRVLFNSGIGPVEQIKTVQSGSTGITLPPESDWIDLPVGQQVKDHSRYELTFNVTKGLTTYSQEQLVHPSQVDIDLFNAGSGVLTQSFQRLDIFRQITISDGHTVMFQAHCSSDGNDTLKLGTQIGHGLTSAGTLGIDAAGTTLFTKEPWTNTDTDREAWGLFLDEILDLGRKSGSPIIYSGGTDVTSDDILGEDPSPGIHMVGSAKIGTDDGRDGGTSVVDLDTKVYGTENLFVVDASFHPDLPTGNTQAIVMVAAERAVERIIALRS